MTPGVRGARQRAAAADALLRLMPPLSQHLTAVAAEHGLTVVQALALDRLPADAPTPMSELARLMRCDTSNLTGIVDRLEDRGLIERVTPRTDRRVRAVQLTDAGRELRASVSRAVREGNPLLAGLSAQECDALTTLLDRVLAADG
jgi:DNA-binding MarR family transcriptional regulator